ncbi:MAG: ATP-binding cassette domain-containing protein, partial [Rhodobacteraceae bacterium]|nr:ATP-binding cassette domain-containing protein [Paracoccaceae bacterium]
MSLEEGEICALLGENGSGKSTLVKMMYGLVKPDEGEMIFQSKTYSPSNPNEARLAGIAMVFQHFSLFDALTVAENIALGMVDPPPFNKLSREIEEKGKAYGLSLNPDSMVGTLSAGERQRVEIIRCLLQNPKILIMDEPTSVLTPQEANVLFEALRNLAAEGTTILYISHKLEEIKNLCSTATILRAGKVVATCNPEEKSARQLAEMMVGTSIVTPKRTE